MHGKWRALVAAIAVLLLVGILAWIAVAKGWFVRLGNEKGTNPAIPVCIQDRLFEYLKEATSVEIRSLSKAPVVMKVDVIANRIELKELVGHLNFNPIENQSDRGEDTVYWLTFSLPNGNEAVVHVTRHGWKFTGRGPRREYSERLLDFLGSRTTASG